MKTPEEDLYFKKEKARIAMHSAINNYIQALKEYGEDEEVAAAEITDIFYDLNIQLNVNFKKNNERGYRWETTKKKFSVQSAERQYQSMLF